MMRINILEFITPLSTYHSCSTRKTLWEGKFTGEEKFTLCEFTDVNMKNCGLLNVRKHREIKDSGRYITLYISLKFDSLYKMIITSSEPKDNLGGSGKGLITSLGLRSKARPNKYKSSRYSIRNVSMRYL